jgi:hypothetical protein
MDPVAGVLLNGYVGLAHVLPPRVLSALGEWIQKTAWWRGLHGATHQADVVGY